MSVEPELTILMPCLDEAATLGDCIAAARRFIDGSGVSAEVVVADNGSTDGSPEIARRLGARVVDVSVRGYGAALYHGSKAARGRYVIAGDADRSYDFEALGPFLERLRAGFDLVVGNRFEGGIDPGAMPWKNRVIGNPVLSGLGRGLFRAPVGDFHCGLRGYRRDAFDRLDLRTTGMEFASEMVLKATLLGLKVTEVPTTLHKDGRGRPPHLRPWRDGWRHLRFMLLYSPRWLFLYPGLGLLALGVAAGGWLWGGPRRVGDIELDVHTLLYAAMLLPIGFQLVSFAVFSKVFAIQEGLVPPDPRLTRLFRYVTLEVGLAVGALLLLAGLGGSIAAVGAWSRAGFGGLDPSQKMRLVIPAVTALMLGLQAIFSSFLLSVLGLHVRRLEGPE
jgi:glycosyltransferase involved in cell wall biosynthesis